jgi:MYXO-CTERM domain-containing protein
MSCENVSQHNTVSAVCAAMSVLSGGSAMAGIVHFINPDPGQEGHFNWHWQGPEDPRTFENWLDITRPSTDQFELGNGASVGQLGSRSGDENGTFGGASVRIVGGGSGFTLALEFGDPVHAGEFDDLAFHWLDQGGGIESEFPENELRYIGVLTASGSYGWIAVIREAGDLRAFAWAYETEPGVSINARQVPAVGGVALFGLAGLAARRRRRD